MHETLLMQESSVNFSLLGTVVILICLALVTTVFFLRWRLNVSQSSMPKQYRYDLQIRYCAYCENPVAGSGAQFCSNCGNSLAVENLSEF